MKLTEAQRRQHWMFVQFSISIGRRSVQKHRPPLCVKWKSFALAWALGVRTQRPLRLSVAVSSVKEWIRC